MKARLRILATICAALIAVTAISACGDDSNSGSGPTGSGQSGSGPTGTEGTQAESNGSGPASAGDERPEAPDDAISDRPGGPNPKNYGQKKKGKKDGNASGGVSVGEAPVSPEAP